MNNILISGENLLSLREGKQLHVKVDPRVLPTEHAIVGVVTRTGYLIGHSVVIAVQTHSYTIEGYVDARNNG